MPPYIEHAVFTALAKLPADRYASAAEFATALSSASGATFATTLNAPITKRSLARDPRMWLTVSVIAATAFFAALFFARPIASPAVSRQRVQLWRNSLPSALAPGARAIATQAAIAPDGSVMVFSDTAGGTIVLKRKRRNESDATIMTGTEGAVSPVFSPDGKWVGYLTDALQLRKVPIDGGGSVTLAEDVQNDDRSVAWLDDNTIVYVAGGRIVKRLPADGGASVTLHDFSNVGYPVMLAPLPGSKGFVLTMCPNNCAINSSVYAYSLLTDSMTLLVPRAAGAWYSPTGHLLYTARDGGLYAANFDVNTLAITSGAVPVIDGVDPARFVMSASGTVLYTVDEAERSLAELVWVTRDGHASAFDSTWIEHFEYPALSPDGQSLAVSIRGKTTDLWIRRADGARQKLAAPGEVNWRPSWMPDGKALVFVSVGDRVKNAQDIAVYRVPADGSAKASLLQRYEFGLWEAELSRDATWIVFRSDVAGGRNVLLARPTTGDTALRVIRAVSTNTVSLDVALSPDGKWLAYTSNENEGAVNVYVTSFPDARTKFVVSRGGGTEPRWSRDGRELFFESGGALTVVTVAPGPAFTVSNPRALFSLAGYRRARNRQQYDVSPDGSRFVMIRGRDDGADGDLRGELAD